MAVLVIAEHDNTNLKGGTANAVTAAREDRRRRARAGRRRGREGRGRGGREARRRRQGAARATRAHYDGGVAENFAALVVPHGEGLLAHRRVSASAFGKNFMPRVAALLDVAQVSDIIGVESADTFVRPIYAGNAFATVQSTDAIKVITVRATGVRRRARTGGSAPVEDRRRRAPTRASRRSSRRSSPSPRGPSSRRRAPHRLRRPRHGQRRELQDARGARRQARRRHRRLARRGRFGLRARTTTRSGRPARSSRPSSTSRSASPARSSTSPA